MLLWVDRCCGADNASAAEFSRHCQVRPTDQQHLWAALEEALGTLAPTDRETVLTLLQGKETAQAAADSAARKRRQRAVERLRLAVRRLYAD